MVSTSEAPTGVPGPQPGSPTAPWVLWAFVVGGLLLLVVGLGAWMASSGGGDAGQESQWKGTVLPNAPARPDALLVDTSGRPFDLRAETQGQMTVLFFGYTNCPDACPIQMATLSQALDRTDVPVEVLFVTTDPERDTPDVLRSWLDTYDAGYVGLTGAPEQLAALQRDMQVSTALRDAAQEDGDYLVGHYTGAFLITPDDRAHLVYGFGTRQQDWLDDLPAAADHAPWARGGGEQAAPAPGARGVAP